LKAKSREEGDKAMAKVNMSTDLAVPVEEVWKLVGGFNALPEWHPAVEGSEVSGEGVGSTRTLSLAGGGRIVEKLLSVDDEDRVYSYSIESGPLPVADYEATIRVRAGADGEGSVVEWSGEFKPKNASEQQAMDAIAGVYQAGLDNLKKLMGG
jgi:uncharacterized protein YndB with AHSA1/START domain